MTKIAHGLSLLSLTLLAGVATVAAHATTIQWTPIYLPVEAIPPGAVVESQSNNLEPDGQYVVAGNYKTVDGKDGQYIVLNTNGVNRTLVGIGGKYGTSLPIPPSQYISGIISNALGHVAISTGDINGNNAGVYFLGGGGLQTIVSPGLTHVTFSGGQTLSSVFQASTLLNNKDQVVTVISDSSADRAEFSQELYSFTPTTGSNYLGAGVNNYITLNRTGSIYYSITDAEGKDQLYNGLFANPKPVLSGVQTAPGYPGLIATFTSAGSWIDHGNKIIVGATLSGPGVTEKNNTVLYRGLPNDLRPIARIGQSIMTNRGKARFVGTGFNPRKGFNRIRISSSNNIAFGADYTIDDDQTQKIYSSTFYERRHIITEVLVPEPSGSLLSPLHTAIDNQDRILVEEYDATGATTDTKLVLLLHLA